MAIDVGIAEAAFAETLTAVHKARPIIDAQVEKASSEHYTLQEVGKLNILLDASILLLDEAAEYLDELDQHKIVTAEQAAQASIRVAEAKVYANDAALQISEKLLELGGSRSCLSQHHLDQYWRNARVHTCMTRYAGSYMPLVTITSIRPFLLVTPGFKEISYDLISKFSS